jgi:hypothetical protein
MDHSFAQRFAEAWAHPTPAALAALLHDDVVLYQPHRAPIRGKKDAIADFERLFAWLPALHGAIDRASGDGDLVFIEWRMRLPLGSKTHEIRAVDRFLLKDGFGVERVVYFDRVALFKVVLAHPSLWPGAVRYLTSGKSG